MGSDSKINVLRQLIDDDDEKISFQEFMERLDITDYNILSGLFFTILHSEIKKLGRENRPAYQTRISRILDYVINFVFDGSLVNLFEQERMITRLGGILNVIIKKIATTENRSDLKFLKDVFAKCLRIYLFYYFNSLDTKNTELRDLVEALKNLNVGLKLNGATNSLLAEIPDIDKFFHELVKKLLKLLKSDNFKNPHNFIIVMGYIFLLISILDDNMNIGVNKNTFNSLRRTIRDLKFQNDKRNDGVIKGLECIAKKLSGLPKLSGKRKGSKGKGPGRKLNKIPPFNGVPIITIDGKDSRILDDAISIKILANGNYEIGIYITDVGSVVVRDSELYSRVISIGETIRLNGDTINMLPRELMLRDFSLIAGKERWVIACFIELDSNADIIRQRFEKCKIKVSANLSFSQVDNILEQAQDRRWVPFLTLLKEVAIQLSEKDSERRKSSLNGLKEDGIISRCPKLDDRQTNDSIQIVGMFMQLANYLSACHAADSGIPFIYWNHRFPTIEDIKRVQSRIRGEELDLTSSCVLNETLESIKLIVSPGRHSTVNEGHQGLGVDAYGHVTSPMWRFYDLINGRIIAEAFTCHPSDQTIYFFERLAQEAMAMVASATNPPVSNVYRLVR